MAGLPAFLFKNSNKTHDAQYDGRDSRTGTQQSMCTKKRDHSPTTRSVVARTIVATTIVATPPQFAIQAQCSSETQHRTKEDAKAAAAAAVAAAAAAAAAAANTALHYAVG